MKRFISMFLAFSILLLSGNLFAKEREGADIEIFKIKQNVEKRMEGTPWESAGLRGISPDFRGELIAVKNDSILILDRYSGADVSVEIKNINIVKIVKKSKFWSGAGIGFLIGGAGGAIIVGSTAEDDPPDTFYWPMSGTEKTIVAIFSIGIIGGLLGGVVGAALGKDKTIQIGGKSESEIQEILEELCKIARVKNFQ